MIFYTADTHFGHENIIRFCKRPYTSVKEMDYEIINNWNRIVQPNDTIYHLGDFSTTKDKNTIANYLSQLNGRKILIKGNHDKFEDHNNIGWTNIFDYKEIKDEGFSIVLMHYAMRVWNKSHHGTLQLFGHSHNKMPENSQQLDVGVDAWNYKPVTLKQIKEKLASSPKYIQEDF